MKALILQTLCHCLPKAISSGLKRKLALKEPNNYKELIELCIRELVNDYENIYSPWLSDSTKSIQTQYKKNKKYHSNIMDVFASALTNVWSVTILIYYPCSKDVNTHTIVPGKGKILTYGEGSFVSGHYDLIVDRSQYESKRAHKGNTAWSPYHWWFSNQAKTRWQEAW